MDPLNPGGFSPPGRLPLRSFTLEPLGAPGSGAGRSPGQRELRSLKRRDMEKPVKWIEMDRNGENCACKDRL